MEWVGGGGAGVVVVVVATRRNRGRRVVFGRLFAPPHRVIGVLR